MTITYDPNVLTSYAQGLYNLADRIIVALAVQWGVIGGFAGFIFFVASRGGGFGANGPAPFALVGILFGGIIGVFFAQPRAAELRLQAQMALCQANIEFNTRIPQKRESPVDSR